eukprot:SAG31_NODE_731_length_12498_cov_7.368336_10_plen_242_part_00
MQKLALASAAQNRTAVFENIPLCQLDATFDQRIQVRGYRSLVGLDSQEVSSISEGVGRRAAQTAPACTRMIQRASFSSSQRWLLENDTAPTQPTSLCPRSSYGSARQTVRRRRRDFCSAKQAGHTARMNIRFGGATRCARLNGSANTSASSAINVGIMVGIAARGRSRAAGHARTSLARSLLRMHCMQLELRVLITWILISSNEYSNNTTGTKFSTRYATVVITTDNEPRPRTEVAQRKLA